MSAGGANACVPAATMQLARFACGPMNAIPTEVLHAGRRTLANALAVGIGAARHPAVECALATVMQLDPPPQVAVLGRHERLSAQWAAFVDGIAIHVEDYDDTHVASMIHPGASVVPAALAVAELQGASGRELLEAVIVGVETAVRAGLGVGAEAFDRGWHPTGTMGHLGAATAAARLLGLDADRMAAAIGIAVVQAAGFQSALGSMTKALHPGKAAADGVEAGLLAGLGFSGPSTALEGRRGLVQAIATRPRYDAMLDGLGERWHVQENAFKPYACGVVAHAAIDAAVFLRGRMGDPQNIVSVTVEGAPVVGEVMGIAEPEDGLQAKFSVHHCVAVGLLDGTAGPAQFRDERVRREDARELRKKVRLHADPLLAREQARLRVELADGASCRHRVEHATGSVRNPMDDDALARKGAEMAAPALGGEGAARLFELALAVDGLRSIKPLLSAAVPQPGAAAQSDAAMRRSGATSTAMEGTPWS